MRTRRSELPTYVTKDGSTIRELMHPDHHPVCRQSLAEAEVAPGARTALHRHPATEELYHILDGQGRMTLGIETFEVAAGDTVLIPPGTPHAIANTGQGPLRLLCCCAPAYSHEDTDVVVETPAG